MKRGSGISSKTNRPKWGLFEGGDDIWQKTLFGGTLYGLPTVHNEIYKIETE